MFGSKNPERSVAAGIAPLLLCGLLLGVGVKSAAQQNARIAAAQTGAAAKSAAMPAKDLAMLPQIFASPAKPVSVVFAVQPSLKELQAAGIVASWLGVVYDRPVHFAVSVGTVPSGDAIVLVNETAPMLSALGMKVGGGPTATLAFNPNDSTSTLLVLSGTNDDELLTAVKAFALGSNMWHGQQMRITAFARPEPRAADDAPRWLSTDHITTFAQARIDRSGELQGDGKQPVTATLRLPPDLDYQDGFGRQNTYQQNLALHLDYRYNAVPLGEGSTLDVYVNGAYISSTPMPHTDKASEVLETVVPVPVSTLRAGDNDFSFRFSFHAPPNANLMGAVLKDSSLDISGLPHWTRLPDLSLFARAGYPFSRRADLADTAVVLPGASSPHEVGAFLALMARMGAQTGLPAVNLTVIDPAAVDAANGKDLLVLGTPQDQPAFAKLNEMLPVGISANGLHLRQAEGIFGGRAHSLLEWLQRSGRRDDKQQFGQVQAMGELPDATVEEIEWPRGSADTAIVIALRDDAGAASFADALNGETANAMSQSVSVLNGARFSSYRLGDDAYWVGALSPWERVEFLLEDSPWTVAVVVAMFCFFFAVLLQARLRRRARERLQVMV